MQFGLFGSAQAQRSGPDVDSGAGFRDFTTTNIEAEALGDVSSFLVEHHFTGFGQLSATLSLLTWLGARTTTLRLGAAVLSLPWHNPVLLAEQAATLDLLSEGRLDFGIGKGYRYNEVAGSGLQANPFSKRPRDRSMARRARAHDVSLSRSTDSEPLQPRHATSVPEHEAFRSLAVE